MVPRPAHCPVLCVPVPIPAQNLPSLALVTLLALGLPSILGTDLTDPFPQLPYLILYHAFLEEMLSCLPRGAAPPAQIRRYPSKRFLQKGSWEKRDPTSLGALPSPAGFRDVFLPPGAGKLSCPCIA